MDKAIQPRQLACRDPMAVAIAPTTQEHPMIVVEYLVYDDQPLRNMDGEYVGVAPAYGSITCVETNGNPMALDHGALPSESVWIVPGTIDPAKD